MGKEKEISQTEDKNIQQQTTIVVEVDQPPLRLDKFIMENMQGISRNRIQSAIKSENVIVNDKAVKSNYKVNPKDIIKVTMVRPSNEAQKITPEDIPLDIIYEDEHLMVIHKPAGMVVHPGSGNQTGTLVHAIAYHLQKDDIPVLPGNAIDRPGLVHRLDKDTSGLMVIAKTESAMSHLAKQFFDHEIDRTYHALVWGSFQDEKGTIEAHIGRHPRQRIIMSVHPDETMGAKHAITHYEVIEDMHYVSLIKCKLETGRTHQIRVHMHHTGHPVFNDEKYDGNRVVKGTVYTKYKQYVENCFKLCPRQALHAKSLGFIHPDTNEKMHFESDLPKDIENLLEKWRAYFNNTVEK